MTYLVTGATGFIGRHLVDALLAEGASVRILTRGNKPLPDAWRDRVEIAQGDLTDAAGLPHVVAGCDVIFHLAGELRDAARMRATNVIGTQNLLAAARGSARHVVHLSSVGVMGARKPGAVDETMPCHPQDAYEESKYAAEQFACEWLAQTGTPVTVLRPTIVFGEGRRGGDDSMLSWLRTIQAGRFIFFDTRAVANYVYVGDVVAAGLRAAQCKTPGVFIIADPCLLTEFVGAAAQALGMPAPSRVIPLPIAYSAAIAFEMIGRLLRKNMPLNTRRVRALSNRTRFSAERAATTLGWQPTIGYRAGLQRTVDWYRRTGQLA